MRRTNLDHIRGNEANTTCPARGRVVENIVDTESVIFLCQALQLILEQDILRVDVGEDQIHLGGVLTAIPGPVADNSLDNLQHGSDTCATRNHSNAAAHVGGVDEGALGTADLHVIADLQGCQVLGNVTLRVSFDEKVKIARVVVRRDGSVRAHNFLGLAGDVCGEGDMLADRQTQDVGGTRQSETVDGYIVRNLCLLL